MRDLTPQTNVELARAVTETLDSIEARIDRIAGLAMGEIITEIDAYSEHNSQQLREEVLANAHESLALFIELAREGRSAVDQDFGFVTERVTGPLRAGIGVEAVLHAYRIGHRVTWDEIIEQAGRLPNGDEVSVALARPAMEFIDAISQAVTLAFIEQSRMLESQGAGESLEMIDAILTGASPDAKSKVSARAIESISGRYGFLCLRARLSGGAPARSLADLAESLSARTVIRNGLISVRRGEVVAILPLRSTSAQEISEALRDHAQLRPTGSGPSVRMGLSLECFGLHEAPRGYEEAGEAMRSASDERPVVALPLASTFSQLLGLADETVERHARSTLGDLARMPGPGVSELRKTVLAFADAGMNARATARLLNCHPNTIRHRLSRVEELSGLDPTDFSDLVDLVSALRVSPAPGDGTLGSWEP